MGWGLFVILFYEIEIRLLTSGTHKENVSKHDFIYGTARMSIDMALSSFVLFLAILCILMLIAGGEGSGGDSGDCNCDCGGCCCVDSHAMNSMCIHGHYHCDCMCGPNERSKFVKH